MEPELPDMLVWTAYIVGLFALTLIVLVLLTMTAWRVFTRVRYRMFDRLRGKWTDILRGGRFSLQADLPSLSRDLAFTLMHQWNVVFEGTRHLADPDAARAAQEQLRVAGDQVSIEEFALEVVEDGRGDEMMAGCIALGNLGASRAWIALRRRVSSENAFVSISAAEAMARIDPERAVPVLVDGIHTHPDWPNHVISRILGEIPSSAVDDVIRGIAATSDRQSVQRTFSALDRIDHPMSVVLLEWLFDRAEDPADIVACAYAAFQDDHVDMAIDQLRATNSALNAPDLRP